VPPNPQRSSGVTLFSVTLKSVFLLPPPAASTAQKAVESLIESQILARDAGALIFDNPFFKRWVSFNGA
jgi:hypothetical protein